MAKYLDFNGLKRFKNKLSDIFQSKLVSGTNIKTINNNSVLGSGDLTIDIPTKTSDLVNDSGFINKDVNDLTHYTLAVDAGSFIDLDINSTTYVVTLSLKNSSGTVISSDSIDLPLESVVVNGSYDSTNKKIILTLQSGSTIDIPVGDLISGLQTEITSSNKLASDLVDDTNQVNKFVSTTEKNTWNAKQDALVSGVNIKTVNDESIVGSGNLEIEVPTKTSDLTNDSGFIDELVILSYGHSTWAEFMAAYSKNLVIYCRASSNSNPGTGSQNRLAFLAYVSGDSANPTEVEFQYYRSVSSHTITQQGDQMYVYKLNRNSTWTVTVRESYTKITAGNYLTGTYNNSNLTLDVTGVQEELVSGTNIKTINNESILGSGDIDTSVSWGDIDGTLSDQSDLNSAFNSKQDTLISGTNIKTINNESILGSGDIQISGTETFFFVESNSRDNPFYLSGKKKGVYYFPRNLTSIYYCFDSSGTVISDALDENHCIIVLNDIDPDVADDTILCYYNKYGSSLVRDRYTCYVTYAKRSSVSSYGLATVAFYDKQFTSLTTAQTISGKKTFTVLPESSVVPTTDDQLVNKKYVDDNAGGTDEVFYISTAHDSQYTPFDLSGLSKGLYVFNPLSSDVATYISYGSSNSGKPVTMNTPRVLIIPEDIEPYESNTYSSGDVLAYYYCLGVGSTESVISYVTRLTYSDTYVHHLEQNSTTYFENRFVGLTGAQSIGGVKTFGDYPVIGHLSGLPTTANQFTPKKYVDNSFFDIVAPEYSSSATYDVGDFVIHEGLMYTCNTAISTAEAWDSTHWTQTSVNENFGGGSTPLDNIPTFDFTSCTWPTYSWTSGRYAPSGATFQKSTARVLYESFMEVVSTGKKTFIGYTGIEEYPFIYPSINNYSYYVNRAASSTVNYVFKLPICSPQVSNSRPLVFGYVTASFQVKYDENKDFIEISTNPYPQWWYMNSAYAVATLNGYFHYTIGSTSSDQYSPVYRMYVEDNFLSKTNTTSYTPTTNYNPATKKYVDDNSGWYNVITDGSEVKAGYQVDGSDVYVKRFTLTSLDNGTTIAHGLTNFELVDIKGITLYNGEYRQLNYPLPGGGYYALNVDSTNITYYASVNLPGGTGKISLYYIKTS